MRTCESLECNLWQVELFKLYNLQIMETKITEAVYDTALARIEELLSVVNDSTPSYDHRAVELKIMSDIVIDYENIHFPI